MRRSSELRVFGTLARTLGNPIPRRLAVLLSVFLVACGTRHPARTLVLTPCRIGELNLSAQCGSITVPENAELPAGRQIAVHVAVLPAAAAGSPAAPLLLLVGGPGQAATSSGVPIARALSDVRRHRDLILVDQRGTGGSRALRCDHEEVAFADRFSATPTEADIAECHRALDADTTRYTTLAAIDDYEAIRIALGYPRWNLWGGSYGTRVALAYMQAHPDSVGRVILDGAAPTDLELPLHFAADGQASLDAVTSGCARSPECALAHPNLESTVPRLLERLGDLGITVRVTHPSRGTPEEVPITRDGFLGGLRTILYSSELTALLPFALTRAQAHDDWNPFVTTVTAIGDMMTEQVSHLGMYLSVICAEDVPRLVGKDIEALTKGTVFGVSLVEQARTWCRPWKAAQMPAAYYEPVRRPNPTLILSGTRDPATPPHWGQLVAERLPNSRHVVTPASHGVSALGCAPQVIDEFLSAAEPLTVDTACLGEIPTVPFFNSPTGP